MTAAPLQLRPATLDDVDAVTEMLDVTTRHWVARPTDPDQTRERLLTPRTDIARDTVVAECDGVVVGFGHVWPAPPGEVRCFARTHPAHLSQGVGTALQRRLLARAAEWATLDGSLEPFVTTTTWATDVTAESVLLGVGYAPARYFQKMVLTYADEPPEPAYPNEPATRDVEIRPYREGADDAALFDAFQEAFADHYGQGEADPLTWWHERRDDPSARYDPDLWLVAAETAHDQPVGFVLARIDDDVDGTQHGFIGDVGVRPQWRGRGLGEVLLRRSLADLRLRGLPYATLDVDTENASGALRLYEKVGMQRRPSFTIWSRPLTT